MELQTQEIQNKIYEIRGRRVMLDFDLAEIFEVETKYLKRAVRQNIERFPDDFLFELTRNEYNNLKMNLRCQICTSNNNGSQRGGIRYMPFAFTQEGTAMLSGVLRSPVAIKANINIMRAFVAVREYLLTRASESVELAHLRERVLRLEQATEGNTEAISTLYNAIDELATRPPLLDPNRRMIGYKQPCE